MFCPKCGNETTSDAKFCPHCGAQFPAVPTPSEPETPAGSVPETPADPTPESPAGSAPSEPETPAAADPETPADSAAESPAVSAPSEPETPAGSVPEIPAAPIPAAPETLSGPVPSVPEVPVYAASSGDRSFDASAVQAGNGKKRPGAGLIIGGAALVVAVLVLAVVAVSGLFSSPKSQLEKALAKTAGAYAEAQERLDIPDLSEFLRYDSYSRRISLALDTIGAEVTAYYPELASLKGLGIRLDSDFDRDGRKMDADMALFWSDQDLLSFQILADDNKLYFASPDFTGGDAYGFNTETLGADLIKLGAEDDEIDISNIGFNLFDLADPSVYGTMQDEETAKAHAEAYKQLLDAIEVEKGGKERIKVNGWDVDAIVYSVTVPSGAMHDYINAVEDALKAVDTRNTMEELLEAIGFDRSTIQEILSEMDDADPYGELLDELRQAVNSIGDLELEFYVSDGYVSAVKYSDRIDGAKVEIGLYLGGGDNYVDDWSLEIGIDGETLTVESTGSHGGKDGVFTDKTTIRVDGSRLTSTLRYEPKASHDNFEWELRVDNTASLALEGQLTLTETSMDFQIEELSVQSAWSRLLSLKGAYYLGPCEGMQVSFSSPKLLAEMSEDELLDLYFDILENADNWGYDLLDRIPPELLYALY